VATQSGNYNIAVTDTNGCEVGAGIVNVIAGLSPTLSEGEGVSVFPNPTTGNFEVNYYSEKNSPVTFEFINSIGEIIFREEKQMKQGTNSISIGDNKNRAGIYLLKITAGENIIAKKIIIQK
jgi:hypothetical protein